MDAYYQTSLFIIKRPLERNKRLSYLLVDTTVYYLTYCTKMMIISPSCHDSVEAKRETVDHEVPGSNPVSDR